MKRLIPDAVYGSHFWQHKIGRILRAYRERPFLELVHSVHPQRVLEIGVKHGWGAERLMKAVGVKEYYGFDLVIRDSIRRGLEKLGVKVHLYAGDSRVTLTREVSRLPKMDLIYIDGCHLFHWVESDWENARLLMHSGTVVVFDDYNDADVKRVVDGITGYCVEFIDCSPVKAVVYVSDLYGPWFC